MSNNWNHNIIQKQVATDNNKEDRKFIRSMATILWQFFCVNHRFVRAVTISFGKLQLLSVTNRLDNDASIFQGNWETRIPMSR
jgi:hypothetical protein